MIIPRSVLERAALAPLLLTLAGAAAGETTISYTEDRAPCADQNENRNAYFGDLHIHTGFSYDALPRGTNTTPADAYRFAKGEPLGIPPYDEAGEPTGVAQLRTPLDFAAVTDHAEFFGEYARCQDPDSGIADLEICDGILNGTGESTWPLLKAVISATPERNKSLCGDDGKACLEASVTLWKATQAMADAAYDRSSDCRFTSFVAYEYTGTPNSNNLHRNVIFRNDKVPTYPVSHIDAPTGELLRQRLTETCLEGTAGCDVVSIPHNSNISGGMMFPPFAGEGMDLGRARASAEQRNIVEPLMEIFQHKGNSECFNGVAGVMGEPDELCNVEQMRRMGKLKDVRRDQIYDVDFCEPGETGLRGFQRVACISPNDFFRSALLNGLQDELAIGVNSYRMGVIASTDTHISISGATSEKDWPGHLVDETTLEQRLEPLKTTPNRLDTSPGGLAGVWAVENSRDALFNAMQSREVFGTSGTRIRPRLFAGWDMDADACEKRNLAAYGYARGVPMGSDLSDAPTDATPKLLVTALQDPNAAPLQRLQVIKGWVDAKGQSRYEVIDVAGTDNSTGKLDPSTGEWRGPASASLCGVYEDKDFDPTLPTYYYLRAVEVPSWRWSWSQCAALPEAERPELCDNDAPKTIQEMAWTSPVWFSPDKKQRIRNY